MLALAASEERLHSSERIVEWASREADAHTLHIEKLEISGDVQPGKEWLVTWEMLGHPDRLDWCDASGWDGDAKLEGVTEHHRVLVSVYRRRAMLSRVPPWVPWVPSEVLLGTRVLEIAELMKAPFSGKLTVQRNGRDLEMHLFVEMTVKEASQDTWSSSSSSEEDFVWMPGPARRSICLQREPREAEKPDLISCVLHAERRKSVTDREEETEVVPLELPAVPADKIANKARELARLADAHARIEDGIPDEVPVERSFSDKAPTMANEPTKDPSAQVQQPGQQVRQLQPSKRSAPYTSRTPKGKGKGKSKGKARQMSHMEQHQARTQLEQHQVREPRDPEAQACPAESSNHPLGSAFAPVGSRLTRAQVSPRTDAGQMQGKAFMEI
ncbi:unnamed protein product [Effrenium voratum]|nr:unnamed protein product [Effrenium voratum]